MQSTFPRLPLVQFGLSHIHSQLSNAKLEDTPFTARRIDPSASRLLHFMQTPLLATSADSFAHLYVELTSSVAETRPHPPSQNQPRPLRLDNMVDPDDLLSRVKWRTDDPTGLDKILTDMSTLSQPHPCLVANIAKILLREPFSSFPGYLTQYQAVLCYVYAARGCC
jgi:hypothetical protein